MGHIRRGVISHYGRQPRSQRGPVAVAMLAAMAAATFLFVRYQSQPPVPTTAATTPLSATGVNRELSVALKTAIRQIPHFIVEQSTVDDEPAAAPSAEASMLDQLSRSGEPDPTLVAAAGAYLQGWSRRLGREEGALDLAPMKCFRDGCAVTVTYPTVEAAANLQDRVAERLLGSWPGGRALTEATPSDAGGAQALWVLLNPAPAPPL
jgi:hypothetical protein